MLCSPSYLGWRHHVPSVLTRIKNGNGRDWAERGLTKGERERETGRRGKRNKKEGYSGLLQPALKSTKRIEVPKRRNGVANPAPQT